MSLQWVQSHIQNKPFKEFQTKRLSKVGWIEQWFIVIFDFFLTFTSISYPHTSWEMVKPPWKSGFLLECSCYNLSEIKTEIMRILVEYLKSLRNNSNAIKVHVNVRYLNKNVKTAFNYYIPNFKNWKYHFMTK